MFKNKSARCQSLVGRMGYSNQLISPNSHLESNVSTLTPHVVKTTGTSHEAIIPIASLFSSMDLMQPSTTTKRSPTPYTPLKRSKTSFYQVEQDNEQTTM
jgi:hypothetical protein